MMMFVISSLVSMIVAFFLRLPLYPKSKYSFESTVIFPTPILGAGIYIIFKYLFFNGIEIAIFSGILGGLFSYYSNRIFGE